jgi:hypothetical protein
VILVGLKRKKADFAAHSVLVVFEGIQVLAWQHHQQIPFLGEVEGQESLDAPFHYD